MSFLEKYPPQSISELVFATAVVRTEIEQYARGQKTEHLLLHGPPGSGKSIAAKMIVNTQMPNLKGTPFASPIHGRTDAECLSKIEAQRNFQSASGYYQLYVIIDELDMLTLPTRNALRSQVDEPLARTTLICTTNYAHKLEHALLSRFNKLELPLPTLSQWRPRIETILAAEGCPLPSSEMDRDLSNKAMDARDVGRMIQNVVNENKATKLAGIAAHQSAAGLQPSTP